MPHPAFPPTPAASSELFGKELAAGSSLNADGILQLPSPAMNSGGSSSTSSNISVQSDSSYHPNSPFHGASGQRKRSRTSNNPLITSRLNNTTFANPAHQGTSDDFVLPPPPSRSRKIIQVRPGAEEDDSTFMQPSTGSAPLTVTAGPVRKGSTSKGGRSNATTAAGRKTARKTAHSIIERRRRGKMNEEFETMKEMIPACKGQTMHKLSILQAGIDYMRYLERCVSDLRNANDRSGQRSRGPTSQMATPRGLGADSPWSENVDDDVSHVNLDNSGVQREKSVLDGDERDCDMTDADVEDQQRRAVFASPHLPGLTRATTHTSSHIHRTSSGPFTTAPYHYHTYSGPSSAAPSPSLYAQSYQNTPYMPGQVQEPSVMASPIALGPSAHSSAGVTTFAKQTQDQRSASRSKHADADHEASAALLMLTTDRRYSADNLVSLGAPATSEHVISPPPTTNATKFRKSLSVKDLLQS